MAERFSLLSGRQHRHGGQPLPGVAVAWLMEDLLGGANFHELARAHHRDARRHLGHHRQAVRNENVRQPEFGLQLLEQQQDLRAHGNVQRGNRLIGHHQLWPENQRSRDANRLALPDSPTKPSDSPAAIRSDTSFTGRTHPAAVGNSTASPRTSNKFINEITKPS